MKKSELKRRIRDHERAMSKERDRRYEERFRSIVRATRIALSAQGRLTAATFASNKEMNKAALDSSQLAITKSENAQQQYNTGHNDLSRKMERQYETMMPRAEALDKIGAVHHEVAGKLEDMSKEIAMLRESKSNIAGQSRGEIDTKKGITAGQVMLIAAGGLLLSIVSTGLAMYAAFRPN